jgi:hypothetical protein
MLGGVQTVELMPDPALSARVRALWDRLAAAGLPSLASHTHPTNQPHVTVATAASLGPLPPLPLPIPVLLEPPVMLGRALVLPLAANPALDRLRAEVWPALTDPRPGSWVPHVSLALRMPSPEPALTVLSGYRTLTGELVAARSYDSETRTVTPVK